MGVVPYAVLGRRESFGLVHQIAVIVVVLGVGLAVVGCSYGEAQIVDHGPLGAVVVEDDAFVVLEVGAVVALAAAVIQFFDNDLVGVLVGQLRHVVQGVADVTDVACQQLLSSAVGLGNHHFPCLGKGLAKG